MMLYIYEYRKLCIFDVKAAYAFDPLPSIPRKKPLQAILVCQKGGLAGHCSEIKEVEFFHLHVQNQHGNIFRDLLTFISL